MGGSDLFSSEVACVLMALLSTSSSATAAFLASLYIKDIWLGAQQPDTLLTHVQMICDATEDTLSGDEEAIVILCKDIAASVPST